MQLDLHTIRHLEGCIGQVALSAQAAEDVRQQVIDGVDILRTVSQGQSINVQTRLQGRLGC